MRNNMKYRSIFILCSFLLSSLLLSNCGKDTTSSMERTTGFTNAADQEYILLSQEMDKHNYEKVIQFIESYFHKNDLEEDNIKLLILKTKAKEKVLKKLKKSMSKSSIKTAKEYDFKIIKNKITYQYEELKEIWQEFPNSSYGKESFNKYINNVVNPDKIISAYKTFTEKLKDETLKNQLKHELSEILLKNCTDFKGKTAGYLNTLYNDLQQTEFYKNVLFDAIILKYKFSDDREAYKKELKTYIKTKSSKGFIANYLIAEAEFIDTHLEKAKEYFEQASKLYKYTKSKEKMPLLLFKMEEHPSRSIKHMKASIKTKIRLVNELIKYNKSLNNKKIAFITGERVRVRKNPIISKKNVMTTLNYGDKVTIIKKNDKKTKIEGQDNYWFFVQLMDNTTGWIFGKYLLFFIY